MADPREFIVFDTETTGMPPGARLVEIGAIKVRGESVIDRFDSLVNPQIPIPSQVVSVHGISDEDVQDAPHAREVLLKFADWAGKLPLLGHNVAFDAAMLATESLRAGLSLPKNPTYCTLQSARRFLRRKSHSLENLVRDLDLPTAEHHRASSDALHTLHVLWRIQEVASCRAVLKKGRAVHEFAPQGVELNGKKIILQEAAQSKEPLDIRYRFADGRIMSLLLTPRFFYQRQSHSWMEATCHHAGYDKTYRMDRIIAAQWANSTENSPQIESQA